MRKGDYPPYGVFAVSPSVDGPTAIPSLPLSNTNPVTHLANHSSPVASFLGGTQRMAQPEVGPQERQEPPTHSLRIPVPGSRPGSQRGSACGPLPSQREDRCGVEKPRATGAPLSFCPGAGQAPGCPLPLGVPARDSQSPPGLQSSPSLGLARSLLSPNRRRARHRDLRATQKMPALPDPSVGGTGFHSCSRDGAAVRTRASPPLCQLSVYRQTGTLRCRASRQGLEPPSSSLSTVPETYRCYHSL